MSGPLSFYEFFAGGGMARLGLGGAWRCAFANDFDPIKTATYRANFGGDDLVEGDVFALKAEHLPGQADLAWASSPCQDFSLAGRRAGLDGGKSSAFFGFWRLMQALGREGRAPRLIVIENVVGLLNSNGGADFTALCEALDQEGYRFGALEIDAARFVPQSRPRVFMIASRGSVMEGPSAFHSRAIRAAQARLPAGLAEKWVWWACPEPGVRNADLAAMIEDDAVADWRSPAQTEQLMALMPKAARDRLKESSERLVGAVFRRMRAHGQTAEVRFDGLAGCLRTPRGGSSRQILVVAEKGTVRSRLISPREGARLMGLPDTYILPRTATGGLQVVGDGVAAPVVRHLAENLLVPLLIGESAGLCGGAAAA